MDVDVDALVNSVLNAVAVDGAKGVGGAVVRYLERTFGSAPRDRARLIEEIKAVKDDPEFCEEIRRAVPRSVVQRPARPDPFVNHDDLRHVEPGTGLTVLFGPPGCGKRTVARWWAHAWAPKFSSGCLVVDLGKYRSHGTLDVPKLLRYLLQRLGVPEGEIAEDSRKLPGQFDNVATNRHFMLVAENMCSLDDLEMLIPRSPVNLVIGTTSVLGPAVCAEFPGVRIVELPKLDMASAKELLAGRCGSDVLEAEPNETERLLALCGGLPRVVTRVGGALAQARRGGKEGIIADFLACLPSEGLAGTDEMIAQTVRQAFECLAPDDVILVRFLAAHPAVGISVDSAGVVAGRPVRKGDLGRLVVGHILDEVPEDRPIMSELVRGYVRGQAGLGDGYVDEASARLVRWLARQAMTADQDDGRLRLHRVPDDLAGVPEEDSLRAKELLEKHLDLIDAVVSLACTSGYDTEVCQLAGALELFANNRGLHAWFDRINGQRITSATRLGEKRILLRAVAMQGRNHLLAHRFGEAQKALNIAWGLLGELEEKQGHDVDVRRLRASLLEFQSRLLEMIGDTGRIWAYGSAIDCMRQAVEIDQEVGDRRGRCIHSRMRANQLWKRWKATGDESDLVESRKSADTARDLAGDDMRNRGRAEMVRAKAYAGRRTEVDALRALDAARSLLGEHDADAYERELQEIEARIAEVCQRPEDARRLWATLADEAYETGHPDLKRFVAELDALDMKTKTGRFRMLARRWLEATQERRVHRPGTGAADR
ncbi:hypothetical protein [Amycolatopsis japonica]